MIFFRTCVKLSFGKHIQAAKYCGCKYTPYTPGSYAPARQQCLDNVIPLYLHVVTWQAGLYTCRLQISLTDVFNPHVIRVVT